MTDLHAISSYGPEAASTRVRLTDWFRFLGIEATHHCYAGLNNNRPSSIASHVAKVVRAEFSLRSLDLTDRRVILSREASPFSRGQIEERVLRNAAHGVYDFDDAIFHDQSPARRLLRTQDKCRRTVTAADVVIAGNDYLANWAEQHSRNVRVIPSCIDPRDYVPKSEWSIAGDAPSLVWLGSPATEHYVAQIAPALREVHRQTGALLTLISGPDDNPALEPLRHMLRRVPWSVETFASDLASADVAIAPLDDSPYSRGKCAYKLLQYAASGLPVAGSPIGANDLALKRFHGLAPSTLGGWTDALSQLLNESAARRSERAAHAREAVERHYSFGAWEDEWLEALASERGIRSHERLPWHEAVNVDVCVVCYNSEATLPALASSVVEHLPPNVRLLLWSNSAREQLALVADALATEFGLAVKVFGDGSNLGFGKACNRLAQSSDREWLLFLNPDAAVRSWPHQWRAPEGALVGPVVYLPDGRQQETFGRDRTISYEIRQRLLRRKVHLGIPSVLVDVDFVSGAAILVRRRDFLAMQGFDETFFMYYEDIDLGRRWRRSGRPVMVEPRWTVTHIGGASSSAKPLAALVRSQRSAEQFHQKWTQSRLPFRAISLVEAFLKLCIAMPLGRVGQIDRETQFKFFCQLLRSGKGERR